MSVCIDTLPSGFPWIIAASNLLEIFTPCFSLFKNALNTPRQPPLKAARKPYIILIATSPDLFFSTTSYVPKVRHIRSMILATKSHRDPILYSSADAIMPVNDILASLLAHHWNDYFTGQRPIFNPSCLRRFEMGPALLNQVIACTAYVPSHP